jgi:hypothetical protein
LLEPLPDGADAVSGGIETPPRPLNRSFDIAFNRS